MTVSTVKRLTLTHPSETVIYAVAGDTGRQAEFILEDLVAPSGTVAVVYAMINYAYIYNAATLTTVDGVTVVTVPFTSNMLSTPGRWPCNVRLTRDEDIVTTFPFYLDVSPTSYNSAAVEAQSEFTALDEAMGDLSTYNTRLAAAENNIAQLRLSKQAVLTFDLEPTANSSNPVYSGGVKSALNSLNSSLSSDISGLDTRLDTAEDDIDTLESAVAGITYAAGDTYTTGSGLMPYAGIITGDAQDCTFTIPLPKPITASTATLTTLTGAIRGTSGYVDSTSNATNLLTTYTVTAGIYGGFLRVQISKASAFSNVTNNTPVTLYAKVAVSFS